MNNQNTNQDTKNKSTKQYFKCLIVSKYNLLPIQEQDINAICQKTETIKQLPTDETELTKVLNGYDTVIGSLPLSLQLMILRHNITPIIIAMKEIKEFDDLKEAVREVNQGNMGIYDPETKLIYDTRTRVIIPSYEKGKTTWKIMRYIGLLKVNKIEIDEEYLTKHNT